MAPFFTLWRLFLAQEQSSDMTDFFGQVSGLVGLTCVAGILWIGLTALILHRSAERRRRAAQGLEPLPSFYTSIWRTLRGQRAEDRAVAVPVEPYAPAPRPIAQAPDLALLTGDWPAGPLASAWEDASPQPGDVFDPSSAAPPEPAPEPLSDPAPLPQPENVPDEEYGAVDGETRQPADAVELLRVWRDLSTGELIMEIGGRRFRSMDELRSADLERRFSAVVRDLSALARQPAPLAAPPADQRPAAAQPGSTSRRIGRGARGPTPAEPEPPDRHSIADQIEDLLQERLAGSAAFRGRAIHVRASAQGGVQIVVDDRLYEGIGEVDDPEVRALLEDVVREWEGSQ